MVLFVDKSFDILGRIERLIGGYGLVCATFYLPIEQTKGLMKRQMMKVI